MCAMRKSRFQRHLDDACIQNANDNEIRQKFCGIMMKSKMELSANSAGNLTCMQIGRVCA